MMKKFLKTTIILLTSAILLFILSCTIGLGDRVDTAAPTIDINYPPKNAVIRDTFIVAGVCDDDLTLTAVEVTITNTTTKQVYGPYEATLSEDKKEWSVALNKKTEGEYEFYDAYKQWEFPDGDYLISAISYDDTEKASQPAALPVSIDNTAPVLIVSKPLAVGTETASVYGRNLNIIGDISEAHETTKLTLNYKEYNTTSNSFIDSETRTLEITGFGTMSSDNPLTIAKYNLNASEAESAKLTQNYLSIYGSNVDLTQSNKKNYYCGFQLEDSAKLYRTPGAAGEEGGNQTTQYFILSNNYNDNLFSETTYSLNARNLMLLLNGQSAYTDAQIADITSKLQEPGNSASSTELSAADSSKFSIDPKNNPVWSITNFGLTNGNFGGYELGSAVPLVLKVGGDGIEIDKSTIQIELYHLGVGDTPGIINSSTPHCTLISSGNYTEGSLKDALDAVSNTIAFSPTDIGLKLNHYYEFVVTGTDKPVNGNPGNSIESEDGQRFGFKLNTSNAAPRISFITDSESYAENAFYKGESVDSDGITIKGTITTGAYGLQILNASKLQVSEISITDTSDPTNTVTASDTDTSAEVQFNTQITSLSLTDAGSAVPGSERGKTYDFTAVITAKSGSHLYPGTEGSYKYKIAFVAEDSDNSKSDPTEFEFKLDNKAPEINENDIVITPLVNQDGTNYINGTVTVKGTVSDVGSGFDTLYWNIGDEIDDDVDLAASESGADQADVNSDKINWNFTINTLNYNDSQTESSTHNLHLYALDNKGNRSHLSKTIHIKQSTDKPLVSFTNKTDSSGKATIFTNKNNTLVGTATDDDGLSSVTLASSSPSSCTIEPSVSGNPTSHSFNISLPEAEGEYEITVVAQDKIVRTDSSYANNGKQEETVTVIKDNGAPEFKITSPANSSANTYENSAVTVNGTVKDGSGEAVITWTVEKWNAANNAFESYESSQPNDPVSVTTTASDIIAGTTWSHSVNLPEDGTYKVRYTAKDKYARLGYDGHESTQEFIYSVDKTAPQISSVTLDGNPINGWYNKNYGSFAVTVSEPAAYVQYSKNNTDWVNMSGSGTSWNSEVTFESTSTAPGTNEPRHLYIKATDRAGNETSPVEDISIQMDLNAPSLTVTSTGANSLSGNVYVNKETDITFTGTYSDGTGESGVSALQFKIGDSPLTAADVTVSPDVESDSYSGNYTAVINKDALADGLFKITGTDRAGNKTEASPCTFIVDTEEPRVNSLILTMDNSTSVYKKAGTEPGADVYYINRSAGGASTSNTGKLTISGTATDNYLFDKITLQITGEGQTPVTATRNTSSWSFTDIDDLNSWPAATTANVTITAYDKAGNTTDEIFSIKFDETAPVIVTEPVTETGYTFRGTTVTKFSKLNVGSGRYSESSYGRLTAVDFTVFLTEAGSGLSKLEYRLYDPDGTNSDAYLNEHFDDSSVSWNASGSFMLSADPDNHYDVKATTSISGFRPTTAGKTNKLLLRPTDNCGKKGDITILSIHVDQTSPTVITTSTEQLTNGTSTITLNGSAYDVDSGIKALRVLINNQVVLTTDGAPAGTGASGTGSVSNDYGTLAYTGYAPADPAAPDPVNSSTPRFTLENAPSYASWSVTLTPGAGSWFENLPDRPTVAIEVEDWAEHNGLGNKAPNPTKIAVLLIDTEPPVVSNVSPANGAVLNGNNTITGKSSDTGSEPAAVSVYYSTAAAAPSALSDYTRFKTLTTARTPVAPATAEPDTEYNKSVSDLYNFSFANVNFYSTDFISASEETKDVWILVVATDKAGNISVNPESIPADKLVKYTIDRKTDRPLLAFTGIEFPGMSATNPRLLREQTAYISISDDDGIINYAGFRTDPSAEYTEITLNNGNGSFTLSNDGTQNIEFKIIDSTNAEFTSGSAEIFNRVVIHDAAETPNEFITPVTVTLDTTAPVVTLTGVKTAADSSFVAPASFNKILGRAIENVELKFTATDNGSGVDSTTVKAIVKCGDTPVGSPVTATRVAAETDTYTVTIPCSTGDGVLNVKLSATDKAEREGSTEKQFDLDNTAPEIHVESPSSTMEQSGNDVLAQGYVEEAVKLSYAVSPVTVSPLADNYSSTSFTVLQKNIDGVESTVSLPANDKAGNAITVTPLADLCTYTNYSSDPAATTSTFSIYFDGSDTAPNHTDKVNDWLKKLGITTEADLTASTNSFDDVVRLYLHLRAEDAAGNVSQIAYPILVDPQGDRPKVDFSQPSADDQILGDSINIIGSVTGVDPDNNYTIYMQIGHMQDNQFVSEPEADLVSAGYTLAPIPGRTDEKGIVIPAAGTVWSKRINEDGEFNPTTEGSLRSVAIRVYAKDSANRLSTAKTRHILIDDSVPKISQDVYLVRWNSDYDISNGINIASDGTVSFVSGAASAIRSYSDGMSIAGKWFAIGSVKDNSGISEARLGGAEGTLLGTTAAADGSVIIPYTIDGKTNYVFCFPMGTDTPNAVATSLVAFYAKDNGTGDKAKTMSKQFTLICDNKAPDVTLLSNNLKILNDNGYYTITSVSSENSVNGTNQTGVEKVAFYFTRTAGSATKLLNPMIKNSEITSGYVLDEEGDGLYWKTAAVTLNETSLTMASDDVNVHTGGLVKINGTIYRINSKSGTVLTLSSAPGSSATTVQFALANVIDNTIPEDATHDDGDQMIERLTATGSNYTWEARIDSRNMSDGPVVLHYVVFDKAGNYTICEASGIVQNNSPRLAGAYIGTDEDGNGTVDEVEFKAFHKLFANGFNGAKKVTSLTIPANSTDASPVSAIKIKRKTVIKPEIIGGNGTVGYTYSVSKHSGSGWEMPYKTPVTTPVDIGTGTGENNNLVSLGTGDTSTALSLGTNEGIVLNMEELLTLDDGENQKFSFTIWDSTPGLVYGTTTQSADLNVIMDVALNDTTPAKNKIIPFYWRSAKENSLKDNNKEKGHIELSRDLPSSFTSRNPKVSGAIKLEGIAQDNSLLKALTVNIAGTDYALADYTNGTWTTGSGTGWSAVIRKAKFAEFVSAGYIPSRPAGKRDTDDVPYASQDYGHVVHWTMIIDTEVMGITPATDISITVSAADKGAASLSVSGTTTSINYASNAFANNGETSAVQSGGDNGTGAYTRSYSVDVVPYIKGLKTILSSKTKKPDSTEYDRTALGHYPVAESESLYIYGFNLENGDLYDNDGHSVAISYDEDDEKTVKYLEKGIKVYKTASNISEFVSGNLTVKVGTIESLNNLNDNDAKGACTETKPAVANYGKKSTGTTFTNFYNRFPNGTNNYSLTDDVVLDVWQINSRAAKAYDPGVISDPVMKVNPNNGIIGFAYQSGNRRFSMARGNTNSYQGWIGDFDNLSATSFVYDSAGNTYGTVLGGDINSSYSVSKFNFLSSIRGPESMDDSGALNGWRIEQIGQIGTKQNQSDTSKYIDKTRVLSPSVTVAGSGNTARVYLAYYDHFNQEIRFRWAANPVNNSKSFSGTSFITDLYTGGTLGSNGSMNGDKYYVKNFQIVAENETTTTSLGNAGSYVDIAVLPSGSTGNTTGHDIVVLVWYDATAKKLKYTYNKVDFDSDTYKAASMFEGSAHTQEYWETPKDIFLNAGLYCKIAVDVKGGIHIAAYDSNLGDVRYAYLSSYSAAYSHTTDSCIVDSNGVVGTNITLDVAMTEAGDNGKPVPYIGYYGDSGPKMAYLNISAIPSTVTTISGKAGAISDKYTGYWEVTEIPTSSNAPKDRVSVGLWKDNDTGVIKASSPVGKTAKVPAGVTTHAADGVTVGNGTLNPVIGYEIRPTDAEGYMETAQKK